MRDVARLDYLLDGYDSDDSTPTMTLMARDWKPAHVMIERVKREFLAVTRAATHPRTPKTAKWLAAGLIAYAVSPIDLIPDFIPVLGHLDDAVILPLGVWLLWKMVPADVKAECLQPMPSGAPSR